MTITELIKELETIKSTFGDIPIAVEDTLQLDAADMDIPVTEEMMYPMAESVVVRIPVGGQPKVVIG